MKMEDYVREELYVGSHGSHIICDPWSTGGHTTSEPPHVYIPPVVPPLTEERVREIVRDELAKIAARALTNG